MELGGDFLNVIDAENRVSGYVDNAAEDFPGAHERAPEGSEGSLGPDDEAAVAGEGGGELSRDQRLWDAPYEREDDEAYDGEEWSGGLDGWLLAIGATGDLEVDEEDEGD